MSVRGRIFFVAYCADGGWWRRWWWRWLLMVPLMMYVVVKALSLQFCCGVCFRAWLNTLQCNCCQFGTVARNSFVWGLSETKCSIAESTRSCLPNRFSALHNTHSHTHKTLCSATLCCQHSSSTCRFRKLKKGQSFSSSSSFSHSSRCSNVRRRYQYKVGWFESVRMSEFMRACVCVHVTACHWQLHCCFSPEVVKTMKYFWDFVN